LGSILGTSDSILKHYSSITEEAFRGFTRRCFIETNHDPSRAVILAGTGRSGTTWLAQLLAKLMRYRLIMEPLRSHYFTIGGDEETRPYLRPDEDSPSLRSFLADNVFTGRLRGLLTDYSNSTFIARGRIVKDIRICLCLKWIKNNFPNVPILFVMRHPCAVVHSWISLGWGDREIDSILGQKLLVEDYLNNYVDTISAAKSRTEKVAIVWCIEQLIPLTTMSNNEWLVTTYEDLYRDPTSELHRIMKYIRSRDENIRINARTVVSDTVRTRSPVVTGRSPVETWQMELNEQEVKEILRIVHVFSLDSIYDRSFLPKSENLNRILNGVTSIGS